MKDFPKMRKTYEKIKKLLNKIKREKFVFLLISLSVVLSAFIFSNILIKEKIEKEKILPNPFANFKVSDLPVFKNIESDLNISAQGAVVLDDSSKAIIFSKNPNLRFSLASTTKIMTAIVALEHYKAEDILTIKNDEVEGSVVGFKKGEKLSFENLLYAMLLPSANDAAVAIADNYPGGEKEFIRKMNEKARELRLYNTHFSDSYGWNDGENYTTVVDLAHLSAIAIKNNILAKAVATKEKVITDVANLNIYTLKNLNKLLGQRGVNGIKTGYTDEAGGILTTSVVKDGRKLVIVVMKSEDRFLDTAKILFSLEGNLNYLTTHR